MGTPTFREHVEQLARGDTELREFVASLDDELLDALSWRQSWDIIRERGSGWEMPPPSPEWEFVFRVRKLWDDYGDVCQTLTKKRAEANRT
jgi:hypothetical protein